MSELVKEMVNELVKELKEYDKANTVVMSINDLPEHKREHIKFNLETALSGMCGRNVTVVFEKPTAEHPEGTCHLAYFEENATNGEKLTLADAFKFFQK